jgi:transposase InsO family protein
MTSASNGLWRREGLKVPMKQPKKGRLWLNDGSCVRLRPEYRNHVWSYDFVHCRTRRWKGIPDAQHPRRIQPGMSGHPREAKAELRQRHRCLSDLFILRGVPPFIRSDNGPEFVAQAVQDWINAVGAKTAYIEPGSPWENGYCESFNARFSDEFLNRRNILQPARGTNPDRRMEETLQHQTTTQCSGLPPAGPGNHRPDGPKADHALTIKLDHSGGADHARLRAAGAIIIGKTVTTEFAYWHAGPTRNPHDTSRTPGGSSSGSCAGLAAGMFALALGSQTAASTIRPAAYCGIVGFKPSRQWISRAGVKALAGNSLDAVGLFGRSVDDVSLLAGVMAGVELAPETETSPTHVRVSSWRGQEWHGAESYAVAAVEAALEKLSTAGAGVGRVTPSSDFDGLIDLQKLIMAREAAGDLAHEHLNHRDQLSDTLAGFLDEGANISADSYCSAIAHANDCRARIDELFGDADILVAPAAPGEAPAFEEGTGSPDMSRAWTLLDLPSLTIPCGTGPSGLPLGIQLAARPGHDRVLLGAAVWIEQQLQSAAA